MIALYLHTHNASQRSGYIALSYRYLYASTLFIFWLLCLRCDGGLAESKCIP